jgi:hypothetical protein
MGGHQISMTVGAEFTRQRTSWGQEWVDIRSVWPLVLNSQDDAQTVGENGWKSDQYGRCAEFTRQRTSWGREWVEIRSVWPLVLNSQDNALPGGENGWKSDQHGHWC